MCCGENVIVLIVSVKPICNKVSSNNQKLGWMRAFVKLWMKLRLFRLIAFAKLLYSAAIIRYVICLLLENSIELKSIPEIFCLILIPFRNTIPNRIWVTFSSCFILLLLYTLDIRYVTSTNNNNNIHHTKRSFSFIIQAHLQQLWLHSLLRCADA